MALIEMTGIRKHFRDGSERLNEVLRGIDLTVERGDFLAIKGASGSGKTTLLSVLGLLIRPDGGEYRLDGNHLFEDEADDARMRNQRIGFVFQDHRLLPQYTVLENILLPTLAYQATSKREQVERALLDAVDRHRGFGRPLSRWLVWRRVEPGGALPGVDYESRLGFGGRADRTVGCG